MNHDEAQDFTEHIAIVGLAGRYPGAKNVDDFWQNLRDGVESISFFSDEDLIASGIDPKLLKDPNYVSAKGILEDVELFDASFFGFTPREAGSMDPQHRIFLECAYEALESAGYDPEIYDGLIGVYAGASINSYLLTNVIANPDAIAEIGGYQAMLGNDKDFIATRVSYKLNLKGPSISIQTACSTSLVAVHLACRSLLDYQCDMALAGGISITFPHKTGYLYQEGMIFSPDGHCRAFDAEAQGTLKGEGVGIVVLKRLEDAITDGDTIYAVIKGSAINNDGSLKVGYTAPSVDGQAEVIAMAQALAGVDSETISYIEAHGTGTALGDPIEIAALTEAFRANTEKKGFCALGSVKTNIGHLDAAAGVTGLIKATLALKHKQLPPSLHFNKPNPKIDFDNSPFYVNAELSEWPAGQTPRRAGVSSFGIGGSNAHVILEEAPTVEAEDGSRPWQLLTVSAKTNAALETATQNLAEHLKQKSTLNLADVAYTLHVGRQAYNHRRFVICHDLEDAANALETLDPARVFTAVKGANNQPVVFMFTGQGSQYVNMGLELYQQEAIFRDQIDLCAELLEPHLGLDLRQVLYPAEADFESAQRQLTQTAVTQPALFAIEYALAKMWLAWGIEPVAMIGHSIGEFVAACLAGVFSLEDGLALIAARGRLMQDLPGGTMLAVSLSEVELQPYLNQTLSLATINSPNRCVVSGPTQAIAGLEKKLTDKGVACRQLHTSHAFHSVMMEPILEPFTQAVREVVLNTPQIPYVSCVTGSWITDEEATDPTYWARHCRQTVRFSEGIQELLSEEPGRVLLEVGPGSTLCTLAKQQPIQTSAPPILASLRHPKHDQADLAFLLTTLGQLWLSGTRVDWAKFYMDEQRRRIPLPTYPFEPKRYLIESTKVDNLSVLSNPETGGGSFSESHKQNEALTPIVNITDAGHPISRQDRILAKVKEILGEIVGADLTNLDASANFYEIGLDSLSLVQANRLLQAEFGINIPFRQLLEEFSVLGVLSAHLDQALPPETFSLVKAEAATDLLPSNGTEISKTEGENTEVGSASINTVERVINQQLQLISQQMEQLQLMTQQLEMLRGSVLAGEGIATSEQHSKIQQVKPTIKTEIDSSALQALHASDLPPLLPVSRTAPLPLSFTQQRLWVLDQFEPGTATYNMPVAMRLAGSLDVAALEKSLQMIVVRHEVLRTNFIQIDGVPVQQIHADRKIKLPLEDLSDLQSVQRVKAATEQLELAAHQPFDLVNDLLLRCKLFRISETDHILLLVMHHIITDRWSMGLIWQELATLYNDLVAGNIPSLTPLPIQYGDFAAWQQEWLKTEAFQSQLDYWLEQLQGTLPVLELPSDYPRLPTATHRAGNVQGVLSADLVDHVRQLAQTQRSTLYMTLLTAFKALLYRYTGQEDLLIGTSIANRNRVETSSLIGFFVNTLLLRTNVSGQLSFMDLLERIKQVALDAYTNQDMPVEKLIELLQPERDSGRATLFDVLFIFQNTPEAEGGLVNLESTHFPLNFERAMFDLTLFVVEKDGELVFAFEYNAALFEEATIERLFAHFQTLLESIVAAPTAPIGQLPMLPSQEQRLLDEWRQTESLALPSGCVHQWFEGQVKVVPQKTAVSHESQHLSYAELNTRANQLANYLIENGVQPDSIVGLHLPRSIEMIVALLGILKAGGAYLPLDPSYPESRLQFMVDDARPVMILTIDELSLTVDSETTQIVKMSDAAQFADYSRENPETAVSRDHLAYIIYTSGSTGKPKGVMIEHGAMATFVQGATVDYPITGDDRVLQFATIAFDTAVEEIYPCLTQGGTLILRTEAMLNSMDIFLERCVEWGITVLDLPTAFWHQLTATIASENLSVPEAIKLVIIGGEKANEQALQQWQEHVRGNVRLLNTYGPTEATVVATMYEAKAETSTATISRGVLIGRPLPNYEVYVLDAAMQHTPIGVAGELLIGGSGLARGYLNRPELTKEKFISNPFSDSPQARLYKSGDLVRYLPDGNIEFLGRVDDQVKIRGFRVELGEIEAALSQHTNVRENVVIAWEDEDGRKRLVAYLMLNQETETAVKELRGFLKQTLPDYMIPANFVSLDHLPMTPNGKIDRKALPAPDLTKSDSNNQFIAPRNEIEETLTTIWSKLLKVEQIGVDDNFFELGGDSILSIQIIAKANQAGVRLTPIQIFEHQTIAELAVVAGSSKAIQAEQGEVTGPVTLAPYQAWFFEYGYDDAHHWNMAPLLEVKEPLDPALIEQTIQQLLVHHDALRLRFVQQSDGTWRQTNAAVDPSAPVPFTQINLSGYPALEQDSKMESSFAELQASLDLENGPLFKVALILLGPDRADRLLFVVHHMIVDGISLRILMEDFNQIYQNLSNNLTVTLPAKTTSYQQWTNSLLEYAQSETAVQEKDFWLEQLEKQIPRLPLDNQDGINIEGSIQTVQVSLSVEDTVALLKEVPAAYNTQINDVLLTALVQTFANWTGSQTFAFDLEGHGRENIIEDVDLSRTIGCFTSCFPVLLDLDGVYDQGEALKSVKEQLHTIPNRGIGYGLLYYLNQDAEIRDTLRTLPQAEISFNYLGQVDQTLPASSPYTLIQNVSGAVRSPRGMRRYLIDVLGIMSNGQLFFSWIYSENMHERSTIEDLAWNYLDALSALISHCQSEEAGGFTPSDFPEAKLNQNELDSFLANFNKG